ncbi:BBE domain-containing protein [Paraburkholderia fungorum]|uniref:BBE domain-containing protein n=1 Tax=Paraburkholderia fungorum TaxID=134537 RepID=UPI0038B7090A
MGTYLSGSNFFEGHCQQANRGSNYARLAAAKRKYDPDGLFFVHRGVNSEMWSADGFTRVKKRRTIESRRTSSTAAGSFSPARSVLQSDSIAVGTSERFPGRATRRTGDCIGDSMDGV